MIELFESYIATHNLFTQDDKILLAVSGGIDSMVMLNLFMSTGYKTGMAHCNFNLRGAESDGDQKFVQNHAEKHNIPFYTTGFDTKKYASDNGISIQMAARDLRYKWLNNIKDEHGYQYISVGHNSDDSVETFFINLTRNSGIHGLTGIKPKHSNIVRPLLFASRNDITEFAQGNNIQYREDSSNAETKYLRNKLRHKIIPEIEKINPAFKENIQEVIERMREAEQLLSEVVKQYRNQALTKDGNRIIIDYNKLPDSDSSGTILFELLRDYGFNGDQVKTISRSVNSESGRQFFSKSYRLLKDRDCFIITELIDIPDIEYFIDNTDSGIDVPIMLTLKTILNAKSFKIPRQSHVAALDMDKLIFPLKLRKWRKGDRFMPFGMENFKKLSDFFIDNKISLDQKKSVWIIESGGDIVWIVNQRTDNRFRIQSSTKNILLIEAKPNRHRND